jgi:hypothetical protein
MLFLLLFLPLKQVAGSWNIKIKQIDWAGVILSTTGIIFLLVRSLLIIFLFVLFLSLNFLF